mmetsp:Transcript_86756/g.240640  ORF Transcript_86756/g.240640 Transcript_86756/m.240640 type:complete len:200 (+) Transcript_86756:200-799(+)
MQSSSSSRSSSLSSERQSAGGGERPLPKRASRAAAISVPSSSKSEGSWPTISSGNPSQSARCETHQALPHVAWPRKPAPEASPPRVEPSGCWRSASATSSSSPRTCRSLGSSLAASSRSFLASCSRPRRAALSCSSPAARPWCTAPRLKSAFALAGSAATTSSQRVSASSRPSPKRKRDAARFSRMPRLSCCKGSCCGS